MLDTENYTVVDLARLFTAHAILPAQVVRPPATSWLRRLYVALLEDALKCLEGKGSPGGRSYRGEAARRAREAWDWVMSDAEQCLSFTNVCLVLDLNAEAIREQLRRPGAPGRVSQAGVSRQLRQPLSRAPAVRSARREQ
jgi:hypothetical protein